MFRMQENNSIRENLHTAHVQLQVSRKELDEYKQNKRSDDDVPDLVTKLRVALQQVQQDADEFRDDLARLREDKQTAEDIHQGELNRMQQRLKKELTFRNTVFDQGEQQHKDECRGLLVQITYLQNKWARESTFRSDLQFAKKYLLTLVGAAFGQRKGLSLDSFPPHKPVKHRSLKALATSALFIVRTKKVADMWRKQRDCRSAIELALEEVHQRRAATRKTDMPI